MKMRRALIAAAVTLVLSGTTACGVGDAPDTCTGQTARTVFKLAFNQTDQHPQYKAGMEFGNRLAAATGCRYGIKVYPNEQLGSQADVLNNVSDGSVKMMIVGGPVLESLNPDFVVFNLPYVFDSVEAQRAVFADDSVMGGLKTSLEDRKNITVLAGLHASVRNIYNSKKPIRVPADLKGMKLRVQQSESQVKMIELMGGIASPMAQGEVYSAIQTGVLTGAENNPSVFNALKHDEVAKYYSWTRHLMIPDYLLVNTDALNSMGDTDKQALLDLVPEIVKMADDGFQSFDNESIKNSEKAGAQFNDDVDVAAFKAAVQPLVTESINNDVRRKLYQAVQDANTQFPQK